MTESQTVNEITSGRRSTPPFRADHVGSLLRPPELLAGARGLRGRPRSRRRRAAGGRGRGDPRRGEDAARRRASVGHRRGVPPRRLAHGLHLRSSAGSSRRRATSRSSSTTSGGDIELDAGGDPRRREGPPRRSTIFGEDFDVPAVAASHDGRDAEADDPLAEHGPLPRRPRRRSIRTSTPTWRSSGAI